MSFTYFRISIIIPLLLVPLFAHGAMTWDDPNNRDVGSITKILGAHTLYVKQAINVFADHTIYDCSIAPSDINNSETNPGQPIGNFATCGWGSCDIDTIPNQCHSPWSVQIDPSCINKSCTDAEIASASWCTDVICATTPVCNDPQGYHNHYTRSWCSRIGSTKNVKYLVDGALFVPGAYGYKENNQCNPGSSDVPFPSLTVEITRSKVYKWDDEVPFCIRGGTFSAYRNFGTDFVPDVELRDFMQTNNGSQDTTLIYKLPTTDSEIARIYPGIWTNQDIIAKWKCSDNHSWCDIALSWSFYSDPLTHLQTAFVTTIPFIDNAKNSNYTPSCPTQIFKLSKLTRECSFIISPTMLSWTINVGTGKLWFDQLSTSDQLFLSGLIISPTPGTSSNFNDHIKRLRSLSMSWSNSLSVFKGISPTHDLLYTFVPGSCVYTYDFTGNNYPLIDRIKPTIEIMTQIWSWLTVPDILYQQEWGISWIPKINTTTGSYHAGSGIITVTLVDSGASTFSTYPPWFNGISGMKDIKIDICRTKTHTGLNLNDDCSRLAWGAVPPHSIYSTGGTTVSQYNPVGIILDPHTRTYIINLPDTTTDGIRVAWEYEVYSTVIDWAGNVNTGSVRFNVVPEGIDLSRTQFVKYNHPTDETTSNIAYTISGSIYIPNSNTSLSPSFANAIDTQTYKMSIFDVYNNPVYNWNLYGFSLTQTGIYLDQVTWIWSGAIFIETVGGILSNSWQTWITNIDGALKFNLISYAPGKYKEQFKFSYKNWDRYRNEIGLLNNFIFPTNISTPQESSYLHIFTGSTELYTTNRIDLWTANDVMMSFFTTSSTPNSSLTRFTVSNFLESIVSLSPDDFTITNTWIYGSWFVFDTSYPNPIYLSGATGSFTPEQKGTITDFFDIDLKVKTYPYITLTFNGYTTRYYVSDKQDVYSSWISYESGALNRIYVEWLASAVGKNWYVNMKDNMGVNSAETRNAFHKNAALLTRNRTAVAWGWIVNRVKYITWNATSSDLTDASSWDVLIIKWWDLRIGGIYTADNNDSTYQPFDDRNYYFNSGTTSLASIAHKWIIVLKDDNGIGGNIYIKPDVRFIWASLFADESIESADYNGDKFTKSNSVRTFLLNKQLVIYGSLFSKNTIWGAVRANTSWFYTLPWKNIWVNLDEAVRYDLAFLRMDNFVHDPLSYLNKWHNEFVVVLTDPRNVSDPLPGFLIKQ